MTSYRSFLFDIAIPDPWEYNRLDKINQEDLGL